jgi:polar amino acid transport system substrate-binding protein
MLIGTMLLGVLAACTATQTTGSAPGSTRTGDAKTDVDQNALRVGVSTNAPPLIYKQGNEIVGLEAELARELGKHLNRPIHFVELKWKDQIPALLDGHTDIIMSGMSITSKRQVRISFSTPYLKTGQMALVRREDENRFPIGFAGILGQSPSLRFGVVKGTTGEQFVRQNFEQAEKIRVYNTSREAMGALLTIALVSRIDILIHDGPILIMLAAEDESSKLAIVPHFLSEEYLAWGIRKNDSDLLASANAFIDTMKREGRLESIIQRWIPYNQ